MQCGVTVQTNRLIREHLSCMCALLSSLACNQHIPAGDSA